MENDVRELSVDVVRCRILSVTPHYGPIVWSQGLVSGVSSQTLHRLGLECGSHGSKECSEVCECDSIQSQGLSVRCL